MSKRRKTMMTCPHCNISINSKNISSHIKRVHPNKIQLPSINIIYKNEPLTIYLPCEKFCKTYDDILKKEIMEKGELIETLWNEVCNLFNIKKEIVPVPKVFIVIGKGVIAHRLSGEAYSSLPITVEAPTAIHVYNPNVQFTPYTYYIESLMRYKDEPILSEAIIHEFCHNAFTLADINNKGYLLEFIYKATNPSKHHIYSQLIPFAGILPDYNYPLTPATLLTEAPAIWGEEKIVDKLFGDAEKRLNLRWEFFMKRDIVFNQKFGKYFSTSLISPQDYIHILKSHRNAVKDLNLNELYHYVEQQFSEILNIDIDLFYERFNQFCRIEFHDDCGFPPDYNPTDEISLKWDEMLEKEFNYTY